MSTHVQVHDEVANALQSRAGVVLLETAVLTQGLPDYDGKAKIGKMNIDDHKQIASSLG
ncbi:MAG: hypothetical protein HN811_03095, partial [Phycisphaerae bacterium]|nr:hypothetical protein [Phycisphaerae bacterium]